MTVFAPSRPDSCRGGTGQENVARAAKYPARPLRQGALDWGAVMTGPGTLRALAIGVVLAVAGGVIPAAAAPARMPVSVVAGDTMATSLRVTPDATSREVTMPGLAALRHATTPEAARAALHQHLQSVGGEATRPEPSDKPALDSIFVIGDLDGDRRHDLVYSEYGMTGTTQFVAVAGDTGRRLWSVEGTTGDRMMRDTYAWPLNGADSGGALLLTATYEDISSDAFWGLRITVDMTAVAADGATRWTKSTSGALSFGEAGLMAANLGFPLGVGPINGGGDDVLMRTDETVYSFLSGGTSRLEVLDGESGRVTAVAAAASELEAPSSQLVDDLDGDGLRDIVTASSVGGHVLVVAAKGSDGRPLWQSSFEGMPVYWIDPAGDVDGDTTADLLLTAFDWEGMRSLAITVASGADGAIRWRTASDGVLPAGDIDGDKRDDLLLLDAIDDRRGIGLRYRAVTASGDALYRRAYTAHVPKGAALILMMIGPVGDLDADGSDDIAHEISIFGFDESSSSQEQGVVLTRTGRKAYDKMSGSPLYASVDGQGDDFVRMRRSTNGVEIIARDGRTGGELWQRNVPIPGYRGGYVHAADLTRDGRAELLVVGMGQEGAVLKVIDARTRKTRWTR